MQISKSESVISCSSGSPCRMAKVVACAQEGAVVSPNKQCCTQKLLLSPGNLTTEGEVTFRLGESNPAHHSARLGSTESGGNLHDAEPEINPAESFQWPTGAFNLSVVIPRLASVERVVAGTTDTTFPAYFYKSSGHSIDNKPALEALMETRGSCVTEGSPNGVLFGTSNPDYHRHMVKVGGAPSDTDAFRSSGISATKTAGGGVDTWIADLPFCMLATKNYNKHVPEPFGGYVWPQECTEACGSSSTLSRILHVNALSGTVTSVKNSTDSIFLDVAVSKKDDGGVHLAMLHLQRAEADAVYTGGIYRQAPQQEGRQGGKIMRPAGCPDQADATCPFKCSKALSSLTGWKDSEYTGTNSDWGSTYEGWHHQRGLPNWPDDGNFTEPTCVESDCSGCFHTCPSYSLSFADATAVDGSFTMQEAEPTTVTMISCVIPSIAADETRVFVMTSSAVTVFNHMGEQLTSWESQKLQYQGWWSLYSNFQNNNRPGNSMYEPLKGPTLANHNYYKVGAWLLSHMGGRMGGQITLSKDTADAYFTTVQGHIFRCTVGGEGQSTTLSVTELLQSEVHVYQGATLQTYHVPGAAEVQKRLYVSVWNGNTGNNPFNPSGLDASPKPSSIVKINLNHLESLGSQYLEMKNMARRRRDSTARWEAPVLTTRSSNDWSTPRWTQNVWTQATKDTWESFTTQVSTPKSMMMGRTTRLAYVKGKIYYMASPMAPKRANLYSTDVTMAVNCDAAFALTNTSFYNWEVSASNYGKALSSGFQDFELQESAAPVTFPWRFEAYKKVVQWGAQHLVSKEMLCSKPKPPTTRPSSESCCTRKRVISLSTASDTADSTCTLKELMEQL